jgi:hypothetical protein
MHSFAHMQGCGLWMRLSRHTRDPRHSRAHSPPLGLGSRVTAATAPDGQVFVSLKELLPTARRLDPRDRVCTIMLTVRLGEGERRGKSAIAYSEGAISNAVCRAACTELVFWLPDGRRWEPSSWRAPSSPSRTVHRRRKSPLRKSPLSARQPRRPSRSTVWCRAQSEGS